MASVVTAQHAEESATMALKKKSAVLESIEDITYGSIAGIAGKYIEYPFDTVKVRLQSQPHGCPPLYSGPMDCFSQSIRSGGLLSLYRGITAPLVGAAMENSSLFFWERVGRDLVYLSGTCPAGEPLPLGSLWFTGAFSGAFTSLVLTPVELVKCKIQVQMDGKGAKCSKLRPIQIVRDIYAHEGIRGFWHGQLGTFIRETGGCAAWFGAKETVTNLFIQMRMRKAVTETDRTTIAATPLPLWEQAVAGASGGVSYNFLCYPADTIKSRMQTTPVGISTQGQTFLKEGTALWKETGLKGLYRGCGITCLRSAPSSAFIFIVYDGLKRHLNFA